MEEELTKDFAECRLKIGSVLRKKSYFDEMLDKRLTEFLGIVQRQINRYLRYFGEINVEKAKEILTEHSVGSGRQYRVVDLEGNILEDWVASSPNDPPAQVTELLINSISYKFGPDDNMVRVGVYTDSTWEHGGIAFYGKGFFPNEPEVGVIVTDGREGTSVKEYAIYLEYGTENMAERPFLKPAFDQTMAEHKKVFLRELREGVEKTFRRKKIPLYFRLYPR